MRHFFFVLALLVSFNVQAKDAPSFKGDLMSGGSTSLSQELKKGNPVLLSFWATWCGPCIEELTHVKEYLAKNPNFPLTVLTVNADTSETESAVKPTLRLHKFDFPVILDPQHNILNLYHSDGTLPFSVLISPKGKIAETFNGYNEAMFDKVRALADSSGKSTKKK